MLQYMYNIHVHVYLMLNVRLHVHVAVMHMYTIFKPVGRYSLLQFTYTATGAAYVIVYICLPLPSNQSFYRLITGYRMGGANC